MLEKLVAPGALGSTPNPLGFKISLNSDATYVQLELQVLKF